MLNIEMFLLICSYIGELTQLCVARGIPCLSLHKSEKSARMFACRTLGYTMENVGDGGGVRNGVVGEGGVRNGAVGEGDVRNGAVGEGGVRNGVVGEGDVRNGAVPANREFCLETTPS